MNTTVTPPRPSVLYVDDQVGNLTTFRANFRRYADIKTATSGEEALQLLETEEFPIVISDQRMEGLSGTELLTRVRQRYPDSIRILLTAHSDFSAVVDAINEGQIARFVRKPWDREEMRVILEDASRLYWKTRENRALTQQFVQQARLAVVGQSVARLSEELSGYVAGLRAIDGLMINLGLQPEDSPDLRKLLAAIRGVEQVAALMRTQAGTMTSNEDASTAA